MKIFSLLKFVLNMYKIVIKKPLKSTKVALSVCSSLGVVLYSSSFYDPLRVAIFPMVLGTSPCSTHVVSSSWGSLS